MIKLGLALGGGGARGFAHLGVLKVLEKEQIPIYAITGCSMGALIGGLYAYFGSAKEVDEFIAKVISDPDFIKYGIQAYDKVESGSGHLKFDDYFDYLKVKLSFLKLFNNQSVFNEETTEKMFSYLPDKRIEDLPIKFSAIATDLLSGEEINITTGSLRDAIRASAAIPGFFPPVKLKNYLLVDGSASESVPVAKVKEIGAQRVVAVDVSKCLKDTGPLDNGIEIIYRTEDITSFHLSQERLLDADLIIRPKVKDLSWANFNAASDIIKEGELAAGKMLSEIKELSSENKLSYSVRKFFRNFKK